MVGVGGSEDVTERRGANEGEQAKGPRQEAGDWSIRSCLQGRKEEDRRRIESVVREIFRVDKRSASSEELITHFHLHF